MMFRRRRLPQAAVQRLYKHGITPCLVRQTPSGTKWCPALVPHGNGENGFQKYMFIRTPYDPAKLDEYISNCIYFSSFDFNPPPAEKTMVDCYRSINFLPPDEEFDEVDP